MSDFGQTKKVWARNEHRCEACLGPIVKGELHHQYKGVWHGEWQNWRMHHECYEKMDFQDFEDGFESGCIPMPEDVRMVVEMRKVVA